VIWVVGLAPRRTQEVRVVARRICQRFLHPACQPGVAAASAWKSAITAVCRARLRDRVFHAGTILRFRLERAA
jgi:hypothetical protein